MLKGKLVGAGRLVGVLAAGLLLLGVVGVAPAFAGSAWWGVESRVKPSYLPPGGEGKIYVTASNDGDEAVNATGVPVIVRDRLPAGLEATAIAGAAGVWTNGFGRRGGASCELAELSCTWSGPEPLQPYEPVVVTISVKVVGAVSGSNEASVSGGEGYLCKAVSPGGGRFTSRFCRVAEEGVGSFEGELAGSVLPGASGSSPVTVSSLAVPFGVASYGMAPESEGGALDTQAGSHPFQLTTLFSLNQTAFTNKPPALVRDLGIALPAGLIGNANVVPQCTAAQFSTNIANEIATNACPADTAVGVVSVVADAYVFGLFSVPKMEVVPLFNLVPGVGEPARFGFVATRVPTILDTSVRTGGDYGVTVSANNVPETIGFISSRVTFWGVPGDPRHDLSRGWNCLGGGVDEGHSPCNALGVAAPVPLLSLPTSCTGPLQSTVSASSWPTRANPGGISNAPFGLSEPGVSLTGCDRLPFAPELDVAPDSGVGGTPTGLGVDLRIPVLEAAEGLMEGNLKKAVVSLPAGVVINPGAANGLGVCTPEEIGLDNANAVSCPDAAKVGTVEAVSPALHKPLVGSVYEAQQGNNPFGSLLALYLALEGEGVLIKSAGEVHLDPVTGQVTATFDNIPQQPTSDIKLHFFGGSRAALVTPAGCGTYTSTSLLTPYNTLTPAEPFSAFQVTSGANGSGCGAQGFGPSFAAGMVNNQAGAFGPFSVTFSRQDQEQGLGGVSVKTPPGLLGLLKSVQLCGEPQAALGTCGVGSLIGHTTVAAGAGPDPVDVGGQVFLTGPYKGAPFGLSIVVPAAVGPFNLGNVVVRAAISVDPHTAQITVMSDPLPTILQGVLLQVRTVNVTIDRAGFMFNPTDCEPLAVGGTLASTQGVSVGVSSRFQAANCAALAFKPKFTVSAQARTSKKNGASLDVKVASGAGQANIAKAAVTLPRQLPSRLTTIQQACPEAVFDANPASCPVGSNIGTVTATTPVLAGALTGPAYLVSHGGAAFPDLVVVLQGEGITLDLVGSIDIKKGVTSSAFDSVPDAPISSFELKLPEGPHSGLAAVLPAKAKGSLCGTSLTMPTTLTGQNGIVVKQSTKIAVTGCPKAKKAKKANKHKKKAKKGKRKGK